MKKSILATVMVAFSATATAWGWDSGPVCTRNYDTPWTHATTTYQLVQPYQQHNSKFPKTANYKRLDYYHQDTWVQY